VDVVDHVAIGTPRRVRRFAIQCLTVDTGVKIELRVVVTIAANNPLKVLLVGEVFHVGVLVAVDALEVAVHGFQEYGIVNVQ
jgi:hypothetical protein